MQISLEQCKSGKFHVFANFCPKVDKLAGGDHFGPDIICAQAKRPHTALHRKHWGSGRENGTEGRITNLRINDIVPILSCQRKCITQTYI